MQARAPDEGPSGGWSSASESGGQLVSQSTKNEERYDPNLLRAVVKKYSIKSTKSLVAASNVATDKDELAVLLGWLCKYHERREDCLMPKTVIEYAELANIAPRSTSEEDIIKNLVGDLCSCISEEEFLTPNVAAALHRTLVRVNPSASGGVAKLVTVARKLLSSLSATPNLRRENFTEHEASFLALQTLFSLLISNQDGIEQEEKKELRQTVAQKERALEKSCKYYPVKFHFQALRQAVERIKARDSSFIAEAVSYIACGFCEFAHVIHFLRMMITSGIDPAGVVSAYGRRRAFTVDARVAKRPWFDLFRNLMATRLEAAKDETKQDLFRSVCDIAIENQRRTKYGEDLKALRFGTIAELGMLAIEGSSESTRIEATISLTDLVTGKAIHEGWISDGDILIALLDVIYEVHKSGQCNEKTEEALVALHQSCEGSARYTMMAWLDGKSMEEKLRARSPQTPLLKRKDLFIKTRKDVGYTPPTRKDLVELYLQDDFATVMSRKNEPSRR